MDERRRDAASRGRVRRAGGGAAGQPARCGSARTRCSPDRPRRPSPGSTGPRRAEPPRPTRRERRGQARRTGPDDGKADADDCARGCGPADTDGSASRAIRPARTDRPVHGSKLPDRPLPDFPAATVPSSPGRVRRSDASRRDSPTGSSSGSITRRTRRIDSTGSVAPETDSDREGHRNPTPGNWSRYSDQADDRVVHFDAGRDAVDREPSTVGHHDGVVLQCHRAAPARAREFDLPDQVRDQLRGLRGRRRATASSVGKVTPAPLTSRPPPESSSIGSDGSGRVTAGLLPLAWTPKAASFIAHPRNDLPPAGGTGPVRVGGGLGCACSCRNPLRLAESI